MPKDRPGATDSFVVIAYASFQTYIIENIVLVSGLGQGYGTPTACQ